MGPRPLEVRAGNAVSPLVSTLRAVLEPGGAVAAGRRLSSIVLFGAVFIGACSSTAPEPETSTEPPASTATSAVPQTSTTSTTAPPTTTIAAAPTTTTTPMTTTTATTLPPTADLQLEEVGRITGAISPKSIVHSGNGLFFAQNMMYRHTITVYDREFDLVATIEDRLELSEFGVDGYEGQHLGAPVEVAFTSDGAFAYVSNYRMYGQGFGRAGGDGCNRGAWDDSFLYRIDVDQLEIDQVIPVGAVPKFVAGTPDDSRVLVTNWCSFDLSIIDASLGEEVGRVDLGRHPRGIAITADSATAYVAVMGSSHIAVVDLGDLTVDWMRGVGSNPRHLVLSPDGAFLYATLNGEGRVIKIDLARGEVVTKVGSGNGPRSMTISPAGDSLYVVNYHSDTVSKIRTEDMVEVQNVAVDHHPIGITYDEATGNVWVSSYSGAVTIFGQG